MKLAFGRVMRLLSLRWGGKEALVNVERDRRYSYAQLHLLTNRIASMLGSRLGIQRGDTFLMILENDNLSLLQFPTIFKQAGTAALANLRDSLVEHRWQVELVRPKAAFIETRLLVTHYTMLREQGCAVIVMDSIPGADRGRYPEALSFWDLIADASEEESEVELDEDSHTVMLRFTGGTTGRSKCAMYTIRNWFAGRDSCLMNPSLGFNSTVRTLHVAPLSHGTQLFFYPTLFAGGTNVTTNSVDLDQIRAYMASERITHSFLVPTILYRLLELQRARPLQLGSLRSLIYGAAPMNPTRLKELIGCFGPIFAQGYAATEVPMLISVLDKADHRTDTERAIAQMSSAGNVTAGVEVIITDEAGNTLDTGKVGEIRIRSNAVISGYLGDPVSTAKEFQNGAWRSGDLGYLDEYGYLFIVDRLKDMIISGGFNIYAVEVEAALGTHAGVLNSAVIGLPHAEWGEAVHAEVQLRAGCSVTAQELIAHVKQAIGSYKAPKTITFTQQLPLSAAGKVLRRVVKARHLATLQSHAATNSQESQQ